MGKLTEEERQEADKRAQQLAEARVLDHDLKQQIARSGGGKVIRNSEVIEERVAELRKNKIQPTPKSPSAGEEADKRAEQMTTTALAYYEQMQKTAKESARLHMNPIDRAVDEVAEAFAKNGTISDKDMANLIKVLPDANKDILNAALADANNYAGQDKENVKIAAAKVAIYHNFASENMRKTKVPEAIAEYVEKSANAEYDSSNSLRKTINTKQLVSLSRGVECIAGTVIDKENPRAKEALHKASGKIVEASAKLINEQKGHGTIEVRKGIAGAIKGAWNSFVQKLENLTTRAREKNDRAESLKDFIMGKATIKDSNVVSPPAKAVGKQQGQSQSNTRSI